MYPGVQVDELLVELGEVTVFPVVPDPVDAAMLVVEDPVEAAMRLVVEDLADPVVAWPELLDEEDEEVDEDDDEEEEEEEEEDEEDVDAEECP